MDQYYETKCLICGRFKLASTKHIVCSICADQDTDIVPEYIVKLQKIIMEQDEIIASFDKGMRRYSEAFRSERWRF